MDDIFMQVGVGGVLVLLVLDRVFAFLKTRNGQAAIGTQSIEAWRDLNKKAQQEVIELLILPIQRMQTEILARLEVRSGQSYEMLVKHNYILEDNQKSLERLRVSSHETKETLQRLVSRGESK